MDNNLSDFRQCLVALIVHLSSLNYGILVGWTSPMQPLLQSETNPAIGRTSLTGEQIALAGSLTYIGAMIGSCIWGTIANKLGRKITSLLIIIPFILTWSLLCFTNSYVTLCLSRIVGGMGNAGSTINAPMYVTETCRTQLKSSLGTLFMFISCIGVCYAFIFGSFLSFQSFNYLNLILTILCLIITLYLSESPVYYMKYNQMNKARQSLIWLRNYNTDNEQHMESLHKDIELLKSSFLNIKNKSTYADIITIPTTRKAVLLGLGLISTLQLCGISVITMNAVTIFQNTQISKEMKINYVNNLNSIEDYTTKTFLVKPLVKDFTNISTPLAKVLDSNKESVDSLVTFNSIKDSKISPTTLGILSLIKDNHISTILAMPLVANKKMDSNSSNNISADLKKPLQDIISADMSTVKPLQGILSADMLTDKPLRSILPANMSTDKPLQGILSADMLTDKPLQGILSDDMLTDKVLQNIVFADMSTANPLQGILSANMSTDKPLQDILSADMLTDKVFQNIVSADMSTDKPLQGILSGDMLTDKVWQNIVSADIPTDKPLQGIICADMTTNSNTQLHNTSSPNISGESNKPLQKILLEDSIKQIESISSANKSAIIIALVQLFAAFCSLYIINKAKRKTILIVSYTILSLSLITLGIFSHLNDIHYKNLHHFDYVPVVSVSIFIISYMSCAGPTFLILSEIFPAESNNICMSVIMIYQNLLIFFIIKLFPILKYFIYLKGCMWIYGIITLICTVGIYKFLPETKSQSFKQIIEKLNKK